MSLMPTLVLTAALHSQLLSNIWPPVEEPPVPEIPAVKPVLTQERNAECTREPGAGNLFGETAQVRREPGVPMLEPDLARAVAAARIAQDRDVAMTILKDHLGDGTTPQQHLARIQLAYALLRLVPDAPGSEAVVIRDLLRPAAQFAGYSDAHYIAAVLAMAEGRRNKAASAVEQALQINPRFYNAVLLRAMLQMRQADSAFRINAKCGPLFDALETAIVPVAQLGACPLQLGHFRLALDRNLPRATGVRRQEVLHVVDLALSYASRKDVLHAKLLETYAQAPDFVCQTTLKRYDFGRADQ